MFKEGDWVVSTATSFVGKVMRTYLGLNSGTVHTVTSVGGWSQVCSEDALREATREEVLSSIEECEKSLKSVLETSQKRIDGAKDTLIRFKKMREEVEENLKPTGRVPLDTDVEGLVERVWVAQSNGYIDKGYTPNYIKNTIHMGMAFYDKDSAQAWVDERKRLVKEGKI